MRPTKNKQTIALHFVQSQHSLVALLQMAESPWRGAGEGGSQKASLLVSLSLHVSSCSLPPAPLHPVLHQLMDARLVDHQGGSELLALHQLRQTLGRTHGDHGELGLALCLSVFSPPTTTTVVRAVALYRYQKGKITFSFLD